MSLSLPYALAVWRRNAVMYKRTWKWNILPNFFEPVLYLFSIGIGVGAYISEIGGTSYIAFLAPGLICVAAMNGASFEVTYNIYVRLVFEKAYDAMLTTPIEPDDVLAGEVLWAVTRACIYGGCFFIVLLLFGLAPLPSSLWVIFVCALGARVVQRRVFRDRIVGPGLYFGNVSTAASVGAPRCPRPTDKLVNKSGDTIPILFGMSEANRGF